MPPSPEQDHWRHWHDAARRDEVDAALRGLYEKMGEEIERLGPTCWLSGKCCRFDSYGHQLWVTALEIAWVVDRIDEGQRSVLRSSDLPGVDGCPFQVDKLCGVHAIRPLGCRNYFCDPNAQDWQNELYERFQDELRRLHTTHGIEYRYIEWRRGLDAARLHL